MNLHKFLRIVLSWILFGSSVSREIGDRCSTPLGISGFCTFLSKCDHLLKLLMAPRPIPVENKRFLAQSQCGWRADQPLVCCGNLQRKLVSIDVRTSGFPETPEECAIKSASRVVGGTDTAIGELPWATLIKYRNATGASAFHCSSTLISHQFAVTAAHCIFGSGIYRVWTATEVRLGEWDLASSVDCVGDSEDFECADPHLDIAIRAVIPHDNYVPSSRSQYHDIALIRLAQSVPFTDFIRPICLPRKPHLRQQGATGQRFMVAGWGRTELTSTSLRLRKVYLRGADAGQCRDLYRKEGVFLLGGQLCAEGAHGAARDSCKGDSGAGLVAIDDSDLRNTHWYLAGIVSFGFSPCGLRNRPGVYTRVADYVDWIEAQLLATQ